LISRMRWFGAAVPAAVCGGSEKANEINVRRSCGGCGGVWSLPTGERRHWRASVGGARRRRFPLMGRAHARVSGRGEAGDSIPDMHVSACDMRCTRCGRCSPRG
jgi:hypothetical protein